MDPVGLALGLLGVVVPAYQALEFLAHRISAAKNFPRKLRSLHAQVSLQKKLFDNECILLFSSEFDESLIREVLHSASHPMWGDPAFQVKLKEHLGGFFDQSTVPFTIITETVTELDATLDRLAVKKGGGAMSQAKGLYKKFHRPVEESTLDALLATLRAQILDLLNLRKQRETAQKRRYRTAQTFKNPSATVEVRNDYLSAVMEVQKTSQRVYQAVSNIANCRCHRFFFQLGVDVGKDKDKPMAGGEKDRGPPSWAAINSFKLVLTNRSKDNTSKDPKSPDTCVCIAVRKDPDPDSTERLPTPPPPYSPSAPPPPPTTTAPSAPVKKKLQFVCSVTDSSESLSTNITSLCDLLRAPHGSSYLGALPTPAPYRHLYTESLPESTTHVSLPSIFSRLSLSRTRSILPPLRRYKLAWILSASLLRFGFTPYSTSWFRSHWRSSDLFFLGSNLEQPHISVWFPPSSPSPPSTETTLTSSSAGTCLAKNEQLYCLAIALIEIAYGDTLRNLAQEGSGGGGEVGGGSGGGGAGAGAWNHAIEYASAKELADAVGQVMSRRYAMVVRRCFYCNFAIDEEEDLTPQRLQKAYFEKVECELRHCLMEFAR